MLPGWARNRLRDVTTGPLSGDTLGRAVAPEILDWLEDVLAAARADPAVEFIFVQGHLPVLHPVRGRNSSMMLLEDEADSPFWRLLRRYEVDVYFAGDVHAETVVEDDASGLVQVVTRAGVASSHALAVEVMPGRYGLTHYALDPAGEMVETGRYVRDRRLGRIEASGRLAPIDRLRPILEHRAELAGGLIRSRSEFGGLYDLSCPRCALAGTGKGMALSFDGDAVAVIQDGHKTPVMTFGRETTIEIEFRTSAGGRQVLVSAAVPWSDDGFVITVEDGGLKLTHGHGEAAIRVDEPVDDGLWRTLAIRHGRGGAVSELVATVDGRPASIEIINGIDAPVEPHPYHTLALGGHAAANATFERRGHVSFQGDIRLFRLWSRDVSTDPVISRND